MDKFFRDDFESLVLKARMDESEDVIENASVDHAFVLFDNLISVAAEKREPIKIVSGCLFQEFYNKLVEKVQSSMDSGSNVRILVADCKEGNKQKTGNKFWEAVDKHKNGEIHLLEEDFYDAPHFIVVGDKRFRIELDDKKRKAFASFNNAVVARSLVNLHDRLWAGEKV